MRLSFKALHTTHILEFIKRLSIQLSGWGEGSAGRPVY